MHNLFYKKIYGQLPPSPTSHGLKNRWENTTHWLKGLFGNTCAKNYITQFHYQYIGLDSSLDSRHLPWQQSNNFTVEWLGGVGFKEQYTF